MRYRYVTADVFTEHAYQGNPLAVVLEADGLDTGQMQRIAREFNYSETSFVLPARDAAHTAWVRIFTPDREVPFAGHPNVGTAVVLAREMIAAGQPAPARFVFEELSLIHILAEVVKMAGYQRPLIAMMIIALIPTAIEARIDQEILERDLLVHSHQIDDLSMAGAVFAQATGSHDPVPYLCFLDNIIFAAFFFVHAVHEGAEPAFGIRRSAVVVINDVGIEYVGHWFVNLSVSGAVMAEVTLSLLLSLLCDPACRALPSINAIRT